MHIFNASSLYEKSTGSQNNLYFHNHTSLRPCKYGTIKLWQNNHTINIIVIAVGTRLTVNELVVGEIIKLVYINMWSKNIIYSFYVNCADGGVKNLTQLSLNNSCAKFHTLYPWLYIKYFLKWHNIKIIKQVCTQHTTNHLTIYFCIYGVIHVASATHQIIRSNRSSSLNYIFSALILDKLRRWVSPSWKVSMEDAMVVWGWWY